MKLDKKQLLLIIRDLFTVMFILFLFFSFMELLKPRVVLNYINLDLYLFTMIILGIITITYTPLEKKDIKLNFNYCVLLIVFSALLGVLAIYLTWQIGLLSILIGLATAIIGFLLTKLIFQGR